MPVYDFSDIRAKGEALVTSGGKAPGSEPLRICLEKIDGDLSTLETGDRLTPIQIMDIMCYIAEAVLAGGIRRAATICLFDADDKDMLLSKKGKWWVHHGQRAMANISAVIDKNLPEEVQLTQFMKVAGYIERSKSGEPGFIFSWNLDMIFNPCVEASLPDMGFCNLTSVNVGDSPTLVELKKRVYYASLLGTLQAGFTDFYYLRKEWRENAINDPLLGVSLTGIASLKDEEKYDWKALGEWAKEANIKIAKKIGINPASRVTAIKPEGTSSLVMGTSSGVHDWYGDFYKRRMELTKGDPLHLYLEKKIPKLLEDHYMKANTVVLTIPVRAPEGARVRSEGKALELLDRVIRFNKTWVEGGHTSGDNKHNVSCTINYGKTEFWPLLNKIFIERSSLSGVSVLPYDNGTYKMPPFEVCSEAEYEKLTKLVKEIDLTEVIEDEDLTTLSGEVACGGGGGCEVT